MLSYPSANKLISLRNALSKIPPPLCEINPYTTISQTLETQNVTTQLACNTEYALTAGNISMVVLKSATNFAIRRKLGSAQYLCVGFSIMAMIVSAILVSVPRSGGDVGVVFIGAIIVGIGGATHYSAEKKKYGGREEDYLMVERLEFPEIRDPNEEIY